MMTQELFNETHFSRFSPGARTNIYSLAVVETPIPGAVARSPEFPSSILTSLSSSASEEEDPRIILTSSGKTYKHVLVGSFYGITCFVSANGYWNTIEVPLEKDIGEIVSMDAFYSPQVGLVLAIATVHHIVSSKPHQIVTTSDDVDLLQQNHQFNMRIYTVRDLVAKRGMEHAVFKLVENCQIIRLGFTPMRLTHTKILKSGGVPHVCLILCGTDGGIHLYTENQKTKSWGEESVEPHFPLLSKLAASKSNILSLEIHDFGKTRMIAAGCQNGILHVAFMHKDDVTGNFAQVEETYTALFSPITSISIFSSFTSKENPGDIHMLVTCAVEQAIVYRNVDKKGLQLPIQLRECTQYDSVLCSHVMDVDWDGRNEILVGTYGRELLVYKQDKEDITYQLVWQRSFAHPIYRINDLDLNQDGLLELLIATQYGLHVFQPNLQKAKERLLQIFQELREEYLHETV